MNPRWLTGTGRAVRLGRELGRGGEGTVFEALDDPGVVAKVYHSTPDRDRAEKIAAMARACTDRLQAIAAWPIETLHETAGSLARGFLMKRVARQKDIHLLYGPKTRLRDYPDASYRFLVHVAANLARAFAVVHDHGHVVGDVNQGGVCVAANGTVTLVDCDSFQVLAGGRVFGCDVGIPIYQPPELQNVRSFRGLRRLPNHDTFGLAVLIFQTLFLARHPFAGEFQGHGEMPIERAIRELRFAYARDARARLIRQPPGSMGLGAVPPPLAQLFERAFLEDGARGRRPTALEWIQGLDGFAAELRDCPQNPAHAYRPALASCPLCELEGRSGVLLFVPARQWSAERLTRTLEELWQHTLPVLESIEPRRETSRSPSQLPAPMAPGATRRTRVRATVMLLVGLAASVVAGAYWNPLALAGLVLLPIVWVWMWRRGSGESQKALLAAAQERVRSLRRRLEREQAASGVPGLATRARALYRELSAFSQRRAERLQDLRRSPRERQLRRYLDQFEVKDCPLKGVGRGLVATLVSHGIETAEDLTESSLNGVPGFGPKRVSALLGWKHSLESKFRFNPSDRADRLEPDRVERELLTEYAQGIAELRRISQELETCAAPLRLRTETLAGELEAAQQELALMTATT